MTNPRGYNRFMVLAELGGNLKVGRLSDREFRCLVTGVWAVAAKATPRGYLAVAGTPATAEDVAHQARMSVGVARATLHKLRTLGMLEHHEEVGLEYCHDWHDLNPDPSPSNTPEAWRDRKRKSRAGHANVTRDNVTCHEDEVEVEGEVRTQGSKGGLSSSGASGADVKVTEDDKRLCALLRDLGTERNPKFKVKSAARWVNDMRLLRERDDNSAEDIDRAIRWVFRDDFWGGVIQSPGNLREHFPAIWDRMNQAGKVVSLRDEKRERSERRLAALHRTANKEGAPGGVQAG